MPFTKFFDMSSGGSEKEEFTLITVNLPIDKAVLWFEEFFGHSPYFVTCDCCGPDYSIGEYDSLESIKKAFKGYTHKHFEV